MNNIKKYIRQLFLTKRQSYTQDYIDKNSDLIKNNFGEEKPLTENETLKLIEECNKIMEKGIEQTLEERNKKRNIEPELDKFYGKVDTVQLQVLRRFKRKAGRTLSAAKIRGSDSGGGRLIVRGVNAPFLMHHLNRGVYYPAGTGYAQSIFLDPTTRWKLEIVRNHPTLKINYNFTDSREHETDKNYFKKCYN